MPKAGVMRPLIGGGCSICYASEENVGKKKCRHTLDGLNVKGHNIKGVQVFDISGVLDGKDTVTFKVQPTTDDIRDAIKEFSNGLTKKEKNGIYDVLSNR